MKMPLLLLTAACAASVHAAQGDIPEHPALKERFWMGGGIFHAKTATSAQLDSANFGVGTNVDFERALGMDKTSTSPYAFARMRSASAGAPSWNTSSSTAAARASSTAPSSGATRCTR
jgi:hypothetical protein